jgi:hypothetical protein
MVGQASEFIIPILTINKKRQSDIEYVDVEIFGEHHPSSLLGSWR